MKKLIHKMIGDADMQSFIGKQLRAGVTIAFIITMIGGILYVAMHGGEPAPDYTHFIGESADFTTLGGIFSGVASISALQIIQLGVVVLIATPVLRVFFSIFAFALEGDTMYVIITLIVLFVIIGNIYFGL